jgi:hypothetical protein
MVLSCLGCPNSGLSCRLAMSYCRNPLVGCSGGITSKAFMACILVGGDHNNALVVAFSLVCPGWLGQCVGHDVGVA